MKMAIRAGLVALPVLIDVTWALSGLTVAWKTDSSIFYAKSLADGNAEAFALYSGCQVFTSYGLSIANGTGEHCVTMALEWMLYAMAVIPEGDSDVATANSGPGNVRQDLSSIISRRTNSSRSSGSDTRALTLGLRTNGNHTTASFANPKTHDVRDLVSIPQGQFFRFSGVQGLKVDATNWGMPQSGSYESDIMRYASWLSKSLANSDRWQYLICANDGTMLQLVNGTIVVEATGFGSDLEPLEMLQCQDAIDHIGSIPT
ncbi:hypothetical protein LTR86_010985 [Recurvomyces mirabilis]|nr:hypothetical protein LTR86_010985 [Recurvomyces mirabilis]